MPPLKPSLPDCPSALLLLPPLGERPEAACLPPATALPARCSSDEPPVPPASEGEAGLCSTPLNPFWLETCDSLGVFGALEGLVGALALTPPPCPLLALLPQLEPPGPPCSISVWLPGPPLLSAVVPLLPSIWPWLAKPGPRPPARLLGLAGSLLAHGRGLASALPYVACKLDSATANPIALLRAAAMRVGRRGCCAWGVMGTAVLLL